MLARDDFDAREPRLGVMKHVHDDTFYLHKLKEDQGERNRKLMADLLDRFRCTYGACVTAPCAEPVPAAEPAWFRAQLLAHRNDTLAPKRFMELWAGDRKKAPELPSRHWADATAHHVARVLAAAHAWPWLNATCAAEAVAAASSAQRVAAEPGG